jgi:glycosyltransferase involved in cell wall biosynthesis
MCRVARIKPEILWTYSPMTTELYNVDSYKKLVYHAVDDIKEQPGMPAEVIESAEEHLSKRADIIFTTAPKLQDLHSRHNPNTHFFPNVADFDHFHKALEPGTITPEDIAAIPSPRIGFIGAISGYKVDFDLLAAMAKARPGWSIVLIGEVGEGDPFTDVSALRHLPNIHFLGGKSYTTLPAYLKGMDVAILPSRLNNYTRSMFPMKFFEYLAAGRPVVATDLPALSCYRDVAALCADEKSFIHAVAEALSGRACPLERRLDAAREQTYKSRTDKMLALLGMANTKVKDGN